MKKLAVNIVTVRSGWILQKIAERIAAAGNKHFAASSSWDVSHHPRLYGSRHKVINFYCDVQNCFQGPTNCLDIGLFTHVHENNMSNVNPITYKLDFIFHMAGRYMRDFYEVFPSSRMDLMVPFETPDNWSVRKPTIGIFQRGKYEGKGFHFMMDFADNPVCRHFKWVFVGNDWGPVVTKLNTNGVDADEYSDGSLKYPEEYERLYEKMDAVLIPSKWEGGPIACLEAVAKGVPVIAADVGWCREWGARIFTNEVHLTTILNEMNCRERGLASRVKSVCSYKRCAKQILDVGAWL